jgi:four helix bundle protein
MSYRKSQNDNSNVKTNIKYRAYYFSLSIIKLINDFPNKKIYWTIGDQLLRSSTSIGANLIEAKSSSSKRDFIKYYEIALKSANETEYWLYLIKDSNLYEQVQIDNLIKEIKEICNMFGASVLTLKGKNKF